MKVRDQWRGKKNAVEWTFLPKNWAYLLSFDRSRRPVLFDENFVILCFDIWDPIRRSAKGDLLILNLVSRKQFWMKKELVANEIKAKVTDVDENGDPFDLNGDEFWLDFSKSMPRQIKTGKHEIEIKYQLEFEMDHGEAIIGSF